MPKMHQNSLAARLCPNTLGELKCSPRPSSCNRGVLLQKGISGSEGKGGNGDDPTETGAFLSADHAHLSYLLLKLHMTSTHRVDL